MVAWAPAPPKGRRAWIPGAAVTLAVLLLRIGIALVLNRDDPYPDAWDPQVADLVDFVEAERGLEFRHPVHVDFLSDAAFRREVTGEGAPDAAATSDGSAAMMRALGLATGDVDLDSIGDELAGDGILGLYDPARERIVVRGETLDDRRRSTLVHELTHALQDQNFDIGGVEPATSGAEAAFRAVVEADAEMVEEAWRDLLPDDAKAALDAADEQASAAADFAGVPPAFLELTGFPYVLGPDFLRAVVDARGQAGRDAAITSPPTTEEHILLPQSYLDGDRAQTVATPRLGPGEAVIAGSEEDFGMLSLLAVLGERLDFSVAWPAVQGWAGDASVAFEREGRTCVRGSVLFDGTVDAERFAAAFGRWAEGQPASATWQDRAVVFESCDPGPSGGRARAEGHVSGIQGLQLRKLLASDLGESGAPPKAAGCIADGIVARFGADRIVEVERLSQAHPNHPDVRELQALAAELARTCRG